MLKESVHNFFLLMVLQGFPESLAMTMFVFSFVGLRLEPGKILLVALLQTATNLVLLLPIAFGVHTILLIFALAFYVRLATDARLSKVMVAVVGCFVIVGVTEFLYISPLLHLTGLSYVTVTASPGLSALFSLPYDVLLVVMALVKNQRNKKAGGFSA
ncbi:hypothetical protein [Desulfotomaculum copahuensis]|uniref:Uncharacterized protein n=1 Tax=Desulfotomaculum copahuensis TaxID=1838280 RepID=A0A1B7LKM1_9FIRM|nr:hypothetical protein [Desulfotomaculum copahuensis]OAT87051.1 hypothetical protein A6M21_01775 [Desulfotomaculum copahuensis]